MEGTSKKRTGVKSDGPCSSIPPSPVFQLRYRNLRKSDLAGVIFGCTNQTFGECIGKQLFGLPGCHFTYVQKIKPGMPLFLFNYSTRKLFGVYEAASRGQMNIDPHAWTKDGTEKTQYPAQVIIQMKMSCKPITEESFKHIIVDNYYTKRHFKFELDHVQVNHLLSLFESSPKAEVLDVLPHVKNGLPESLRSEQTAECQNLFEENITLSSSEQTQLYFLLNGEDTATDEDVTIMAEESLETSSEILKSTVKGNLIEVEESFVLNELAERIKKLEKKQIEFEKEIEEAKRREEISDKKYDQMCDLIKELQKKNYSVSEESFGELCRSIPTSESERSIYLIGGYDGSSMLNALDSYSPSYDAISALAPLSCSRSYFAAAALSHSFYVLGGYDTKSFFDTVELYDIEKNEWSVCPPLSWRKGSLAGATINGHIFAVGGVNEIECFSDVEMFDESIGKWIDSPSMIQKRYALGTTELNGALYAVGGFGESYLKLNSVERFDPREGSWSLVPSLNYGRGFHSLVAFKGKIYAIGGSDGVKALSSTEVLDTRMGSWSLGEPINTERESAGCLVLGDSLLMIGGAKDPQNILDTVECYREGIGWMITGLEAVGKRAFFSAVVL